MLWTHKKHDLAEVDFHYNAVHNVINIQPCLKIDVIKYDIFEDHTKSPYIIHLLFGFLLYLLICKKRKLFPSAHFKEKLYINQVTRDIIT